MNSRSKFLSFITPVTLATLALGTTLVLACNRTPEPDARRDPAPATPSVAPSAGLGTPPNMPNGAGPQAGAGLRWDVPTAWKSVSNASPMRKATYRAPKVEGDTDEPELTVIQAGGTVEANLDRWAGQFEGGKESLDRKDRTVAGLKVAVAEAHGTFNGGGMPGAPAAGPKSGWALLGAIVQTPGTSWFFKMVGPAKSVAAAKADFDKLINSLRSD